MCILLIMKTKITDHPLYNLYHQMKGRCNNESNPDYKYYGARGIAVCKSWMESFENFRKDMEPGYKKGLSLDRINNDLGYCKSNCRWVPKDIQKQNRRSSFKKGRRPDKTKQSKKLSQAALFEVRAFYIKKIIESGLSQGDAAFIFNVHKSQITRSLKM